MKLNQRKNTHVIVDRNHISVQYFFTKDDVGGQEPGARKVWAVIKFSHPDTKQLERIKAQEPQSLLDAPDKEIQQFIEKEVECFFKHCDEETEARMHQWSSK